MTDKGSITLNDLSRSFDTGGITLPRVMQNDVKRHIAKKRGLPFISKISKEIKVFHIYNIKINCICIVACRIINNYGRDRLPINPGVSLPGLRDRYKSLSVIGRGQHS